MTKNEKLLEKTVELMASMLRHNVYSDGMTLDAIISQYKEYAKEDLSRGGFLTPNQRRRFKEKIDMLKTATGHDYEHFRYNAITKNTTLGFTDWEGNYRVDTFAPGFLSFMDVFEPGKVYFIEDLLK